MGALIGLLLIIWSYVGCALMVPSQIRFTDNFQTVFQLGLLAIFLGVVLMVRGLETARKPSISQPTASSN